MRLSDEQKAWFSQLRKAEWDALSAEEVKARVRPMLESRTSEELSRQVTER
jgi:hypothetical protein